MSFAQKLLASDNSRFVLFPIEYPDIWEAYKQAQLCFWTAEEIDLAEDREHWKTKLSPAEREFLSRLLAFFAASDGIVVENIAQRFCGEVQIAEVRCFYGFQIMMENIHSEVYSRLLVELVADTDEQQRLFGAIDNIPSIKNKADWALKWIDPAGPSFPTRLVAFAIVEGVFFSSSFAAIFWIRNRGIMPGLTTSNVLISRDEGLHTQFACLLFRLMGSPVDETLVHSMMREAVYLECEFFKAAIPCPLLGMNAEMMSRYVEYVADFVLSELGLRRLFFANNPFPFMQTIMVDGKTNFFDRAVSEYVGAKVVE